jgi:DNA-binding XRE family transcriptional regulator
MIINELTAELIAARKSHEMTQAELAVRAGLSRMTVQRSENQEIDPRLSSVLEMARALGMDVMLVPQILRPELEAFLRSGGRMLAQPAGAGAPQSVVASLASANRRPRAGRP